MKYIILIIVSTLTFWIGYSVGTDNAKYKGINAEGYYAFTQIGAQTIKSLNSQRVLCKKQLQAANNLITNHCLKGAY